MNSRFTEDTAPYAADCVASAQVNAPRLLASGALLVVLLTAMTFIEAPVARHDLRAHVAGDPQSTSSVIGSAANGGRVLPPTVRSDVRGSTETIMSVHSAWGRMISCQPDHGTKGRSRRMLNLLLKASVIDARIDGTCDGTRAHPDFL